MRSRPHVQLTTPNLLPQLRQHSESTLPRLQALPGVIGITLNGGLSRGYGDHLSEIDLTLYLDAETYAEWQLGAAPVTLGIAVIDGALYDLRSLDYAAETARDWSMLERWDASYAEILYDPRGAIAQLLQVKLAQRPQPAEAEGSLFRCWWYYRLAGDIWIHRQDPLQGHHLCEQALVALLEALFLANGEYVPHEKWLIHMSRSLAWTPDRWEARLREAMLTGDLSVASLVARQAVLDGLWREVDARVKALTCHGLPVAVMQRTFYELLKLLADRGSLRVAEWQAMASLDLLNNAPFHGLVTRDGDSLRLSRERLLACRPDEMYAWHYEIVRAVGADITADGVGPDV